MRTNKPAPLPVVKKMHEATLFDFLEDHIKLSEVKDLLKVDQRFLWSFDGLDRYRINVWKATHTDGYFMKKVYISHSFFVHFDNKDKTVTDRTVKIKGLRLEKSLLSD